MAAATPPRTVRPSPGAIHLGGGRCTFSVWAPLVPRIELHLLEPSDRIVPLARDGEGYHETIVDGVHPGALYLYRLDGGSERPDPASRRLPQGVHGPSAVVERRSPVRLPPASVRPLSEQVFYEIHAGTFTPEGTLPAVIPHLDALRELGVTTVELMPLSPFPGTRNWGYDGVYPFAVHEAYGGPDGLGELADACHARGLAVALDVVANHLGPEGNYLREYAPYFTHRYRTPWGEALNFDGPFSDEVRRYFIESALHFLEEFSVDVFRVDAVHAIVDTSARPFLQELSSALHARAAALGRRVFTVAESSLNDPKVITPEERGGWGFDAQWSDDFHHSLHTLLTGEREGYYADFGRLEDLAGAWRNGFVYTGQHSAYRKRRHGAEPVGCPAGRFVVSAQNHDQVGNRARGERLATLVPFSYQKLAAAVLLLSPYVPLLFMGEEYGETAPFLYFTSHSDPGLQEAVRRGRRQEFAAFGWKEEEIPDPGDPETFLRCRLDRSLAGLPGHRALLSLHRELLRLRRERPALRLTDRDRVETRVLPAQRVLVVRRTAPGDEVTAIFSFAGPGAPAPVELAPGRWRRILDTEDLLWEGGGLQTEEEPGQPDGARVTIRPGSALVFGRAGLEGRARP